MFNQKDSENILARTDVRIMHGLNLFALCSLNRDLCSQSYKELDNFTGLNSMTGWVFAVMSFI